MGMGRGEEGSDRKEKRDENDNLSCSPDNIHFLTHTLVYNTHLYCKNIKLFVCLIQPHATKTWGTGSITPCTLNPTGLSPHPSHSNLQIKAHGTHNIGQWGGHRFGLDAVKKRKISAIARNRTQIPLLPSLKALKTLNE